MTGADSFSLKSLVPPLAIGLETEWIVGDAADEGVQEPLFLMLMDGGSLLLSWAAAPDALGGGGALLS